MTKVMCIFNSHLIVIDHFNSEISTRDLYVRAQNLTPYLVFAYPCFQGRNFGLKSRVPIQKKNEAPSVQR